MKLILPGEVTAVAGAATHRQARLDTTDDVLFNCSGNGASSIGPF
jgi:hypothetical protein